MYAKPVFALFVGGQAKVGKLEVIIRIQKNIFWFEVPMYNASGIM